MNTVQALLADVVRQALDDDAAELDARAAHGLLQDVTGENRRPCSVGLAYGPLKSIAEVTRETVYARLEQRWAARRSVDVPYDAPAATVLVTALNVLVASDAATRVERRYAVAERAAMVAAAIAELRHDQQGLETQRSALTGAARDALSCMISGEHPAESAVVPASELMRAELVARLRGELPTSAHGAWKLMMTVRFLVDMPPEHGSALGPLWHDPAEPKSLYQARHDVRHRLGQLEIARRNAIDAMERPRNPVELGEWLATLLLVVLTADAAAQVAHTYADAEAQATALAAGAHLRADAEGVAAQQEMFRAAAAAALRQLGDPDASVEPKLVEDLLHAQLA